MSVSSPRLNHPWSIYLKEPFSSYTNYPVYYLELVRLHEFNEKLSVVISNLSKDQVQLTVYIVGTSMEDALHKKNCSQEYMFQWQQLFPHYITNFIKCNQLLDNDININVIIISPDDIFMDRCYREPLFTTQCKQYNFVKIQNREYIHLADKLRIKIDIFTCPFPQLETRKTVINKYNDFIKNLPYYELDSFAPSEDDVKFIDNFYSQLALIAGNPKSNMIINSWATFRNVRDYDNYGLFPSLLALANKYKIIATEWAFSENNFLFRIASKIDYTVDYIKYLVSYIDPVEYNPMVSDYQDVDKIEIKNISFNQMIDKPKLCICIDFPYNNLVLKKIVYK